MFADILSITIALGVTFFFGLFVIVVSWLDKEG